MFRRRKVSEPVYVVVITAATETGIGTGQCVVGPMTRESAEDFVELANTMVSADWGETLNEVRAAIHFVALPVENPVAAGDWTRQRIELAVAMGEMEALAKTGWLDDRDRPIVDGSLWVRPDRNHPSAWGSHDPKPEDDDE